MDSRGMRGYRRSVSRILGVVATITICGCAARPAPSIDVSPQTASASDQAVRDDPTVSGVWEGSSISGCLFNTTDPGRCQAEQKITLTMFQQGDKVTGFYKCAYGNQVCRHLNETGLIRNGKLNRTLLMMRVMHEDGSMCFFTGRPHGNQFNGGYECLQGGGIIEEGTFQTRRNY